MKRDRDRVHPEAGRRGSRALRAVAAGSGIAALAAEPLVGEFPARAAALEEAVLLLQPRERRLVLRQARALVENLAVPAQAEDVQRAQLLVGASGNNALAVEIFDPHQPAPARGTRIEI